MCRILVELPAVHAAWIPVSGVHSTARSRRAATSLCVHCTTLTLHAQSGKSEKEKKKVQTGSDRIESTDACRVYATAKGKRESRNALRNWYQPSANLRHSGQNVLSGELEQRKKKYGKCVTVLCTAA